MFVGLIFSFSETTATPYKCIAIGMPYVFLVADIMSWWLTKINPMFAWLVVFVGTGMGASFMFMWVTSILEMWLYQFAYVEEWGVLGQKVKALVNAIYTQERRDQIKTLLNSGSQKLREQWVSQAWPTIKKLVDKALQRLK